VQGGFNNSIGGKGEGGEGERGKEEEKRNKERWRKEGALKLKICLRHCVYSSSSKKIKNFISAKTNIMSYIYIWPMHLMYILPMFTIGLELTFSPIIFYI
jgi:hypothetical protein